MTFAREALRACRHLRKSAAVRILRAERPHRERETISQARRTYRMRPRRQRSPIYTSCLNYKTSLYCAIAVDLSELNVFLTVARERSFSRAAQKLFRTQPAVSITIRKLEDEVGEPLFARGPRSGQLTDAGRLLIGYAEPILNLRDEIRRAVDDLRSGGRGELSIGVNESSIHALLPVLSRYRQLFPEVHLAVRRTFSRDIPTELLNYRLYLGVAPFVSQEPPFAAVKICPDQLALAVSPTHRS